MSDTKPARRILLKLSGEALSSGEGIFDPVVISRLAGEIGQVIDGGVGAAIVVGGGNMIRGVMAQSLGMDRVKGDFMGMLATVINALALESAFKRAGLAAEVFSAIPAASVVRPYSQPDALAALNAGRVVILAGGTGNPYLTTDTAAALRAVELGCDALLKATKVEGIYSDDPEKNPRAEHFPELSFDEVIAKNLRVMDQAAFSLCRDNRLPIVVFKLSTPGNIVRAALGERVGSVVHS